LISSLLGAIWIVSDQIVSEMDITVSPGSKAIRSQFDAVINLV
jgi:hypothetical protein